MDSAVLMGQQVACPDAKFSAAGEAPAWQERHRGLVAGLAAALLGKNGQGSGPLMHIAVEEASSSAFKAMLLEMKTQVTHFVCKGDMSEQGLSSCYYAISQIAMLAHLRSKGSIICLAGWPKSRDLIEATLLHVGYIPQGRAVQMMMSQQA